MDATNNSRALDPGKSFRPEQNVKRDTQRYKLQRFAKSLVRSGDLAKAVKAPEGTNVNHWLSVHTVDFYNITNVLYGSVSEFCTASECPVMSGGATVEYLWKDKPAFPKPTRMPAPCHVRLLMDWAAAQLNDDATFPTEDDSPYPPDFDEVVQHIFRRLFRVYAHIYYKHFEHVRELHAESHLNTAFKHFMLFVWEFDLVPTAELRTLEDLLHNLMPGRAAEMLPIVESEAADADEG